MPDTHDDNLVVVEFIKNDVGIRSGNNSPHRQQVGLPTDGIERQKIDHCLYSRLNAICSLWRSLCSMIQHGFKFGQSLGRISKFHSPCFDQTART